MPGIWSLLPTSPIFTASFLIINASDPVSLSVIFLWFRFMSFSMVENGYACWILSVLIVIHLGWSTPPRSMHWQCNLQIPLGLHVLNICLGLTPQWKHPGRYPAFAQLHVSSFINLSDPSCSSWVWLCKFAPLFGLWRLLPWVDSIFPIQKLSNNSSSCNELVAELSISYICRKKS